METGNCARQPEGWSAPARPLVRPASRSAMFFPLVVLAAVLPGLYALNWWNLTPPGPWWGLRGLAVLDGLLARPDPGGRGARAVAGGSGVPGGGAAAAAVCLARSDRAGGRVRSRPVGDGLAQLSRGGADRPAGVLAWPALAGGGRGAGGGVLDGVQPAPADPDEGGVAGDPGRGGDAGGDVCLRPPLPGRRVRLPRRGAGLGRGGRVGAGRGPADDGARWGCFACRWSCSTSSISGRTWASPSGRNAPGTAGGTTRAWWPGRSRWRLGC